MHPNHADAVRVLFLVLQEKNPTGSIKQFSQNQGKLAFSVRIFSSRVFNCPGLSSLLCGIPPSQL